MTREEIIAGNPIADFVRSRGHELRRAGKNFVTNASPVTQHKPGHRPVMIYPENNSWYDHDLKIGGTVIDWVMHERGCDAAQAKRELSGNNGAPEIVATYDYADEGSNLIFQCVRSKPKDFWQRRPDGKGGWINNLQGVRRVLYRLPEVKSAQTVCVAEGEKDADNLAKLGFVATTNPLGAGNWRDVYSEMLRGKDVIVFGDVGDKDGKGEKHTKHVIESLAGKVNSIKHVALPDGFHDVSDYIASLTPATAGQVIAELIEETAVVDRTSIEIAEQVQVPLPARYVAPPLDLLPQQLKDYVQAAADALNVDVAFILLPLLSSLGAAIGNARSILLKRGFIQPPVIWTVIIGRSGSRKSPSIEAGCFAVMEHEDELMKQNRDAQEQFDEDFSRWESKSKKERGSKPEKPTILTCVLDDLTIEVLADALMANPRGILVRKDELSHWLASFDQYRNVKGSDVSRWLTLHSAFFFGLDRRTDHRLYRIANPRACLTGGIQPQVLKRALTEDFFERGLPARILFVFPPFRQDRWSEATVADDLRKATLELFEDLWLLQPEHDDHAQPRPKLLRLDADAKSVFTAFYDECGASAVESGEHEEAAYSKLTAYVARLALVGQLARNPQAEVVTGDVMQAACELARWFGNEAVRIYVLLAETREQREQRKLIEFIERRGGTVTVRDVITYYWPLKNQREKAEQQLNALVKAGHGKWEPVPATLKGGQPTRKFRLLHTSASAEPCELRGRTPSCADAEAPNSRKNEDSRGPENEPVSGGLDAMPAGILEL